MTTAEQIELREQAKADAFIESQIAGRDPLDMLRYDQRPFELIFEIVYWRRRTIELLLEKEKRT